MFDLPFSDNNVDEAKLAIPKKEKSVLVSGKPGAARRLTASWTSLGTMGKLSTANNQELTNSSVWNQLASGALMESEVIREWAGSSELHCQRSYTHTEKIFMKVVST